jgi:ubiquinone/menaquinone biosynthesis C-methylase UbiE
MPPRHARERYRFRVMEGDTKYIHGYTRAEQDRLVAQARYWRDSLILPGLPYRAGERLLDIGCGAGAVLGEIGSAFPQLQLAGIDLSAAQIEYARRHLDRLGHPDADLRQGDATRLPWADGEFDHVFMMWFLEHVAEHHPFLAEARRVLRAGGTITLIETDYGLMQAFPQDADLAYLLAGQQLLFGRNGSPGVGRALGGLLAVAGFQHVRSAPVGFHHFVGEAGEGLGPFVEYLLGFLEPMVDPMAEQLGLDRRRLDDGIAAMRALPSREGASYTQIVFRATAVR